MTYNTSLSSVYENHDFETIKDNLVKWGRKVEQAIGSYLLNSSRIYNFQVYYWRDGNEEVDFIIQRGNKIIPIEVKVGKSKQHTGLTSFSNKFKVKKQLLVSDDSLKWQDFLNLNINELFD